MERPPAPPEAVLIRLAREAANIRIADAAARAGVSVARWSQIEAGSELRRGKVSTVTGRAGTIARMAHIAGVSPERLAGEGQRPDAAEILQEIISQQDAAAAADALAVVTEPSRPAPPPRREVPFHAAGSAEDLQPYVEEVRREAYEAVVRHFPEDAPEDPSDPRAEAAMSALPGRAVFPGDDLRAVAEAETWDKAPFTLGERIKIIAIGRHLRARADERENRRTGLGNYPATSAIRALVSVGGKALRASP